ncbi:hypothetical protein [Bacillus salipaludis]|uniref:hypothetical protein n=1 Tax=Bacillus salipaludis TaxID=2547811 RepID=UPI002E1E9C5E|nr:hypothetical protein [Bacillus salipaludis]
MNCIEYLIIIEELGRLFEEYYRCKDNNIREQIYGEIKQLGTLLVENRNLPFSLLNSDSVL